MHVKPSGIRLGTPAITTRGVGEKDMVQVADWMHQAVLHRDDPARLDDLRTAVREFALRYPLPSDV